MHPALSEALALAHKEDLQRAAARSRAIRLARDALQERQLEEPATAGRQSTWARLRGLRVAGSGTTQTAIPQVAPRARPPVPDVPSAQPPGIDRASNEARLASSLTRLPEKTR